MPHRFDGDSRPHLGPIPIREYSTDGGARILAIVSH